MSIQELETTKVESLTDKEILAFVRDNLSLDRGTDGNLRLTQVDSDVFGHVYGHVYGHVGGDVDGHVGGDVGGDVGGHVRGDVVGDVGGYVRGHVYGVPKQSGD